MEKTATPIQNPSVSLFLAPYCPTTFPFYAHYNTKVIKEVPFSKNNFFISCICTSREKCLEIQNVKVYEFSQNKQRNAPLSTTSKFYGLPVSLPVRTRTH